MKLRHFLQIGITGLLVMGLSLSSLADSSLRISQLGALDQQYMQEQRNSVKRLIERSFGGRLSGEKDRDLQQLQRILDDKLLRPDQKRELQAMGIVLGDLLGQELDMHWVIYEDKAGRSRALRYRQTNEYLFPVTMISRRHEVDNRNSVADIYRKAYDIIDAHRPKLPYQ